MTATFRTLYALCCGESESKEEGVPHFPATCGSLITRVFVVTKDPLFRNRLLLRQARYALADTGLEPSWR